MFRRAIILAGGRGQRLRTIGDALPKCLLPCFDRPLLFKQIEQCILAGVDDVLVCVSQQYSSMLEAVLLRGPAFPCHVQLFVEKEPQGPTWGLLDCARSCGDEATLVLLGDEYFEKDGPFAKIRGVCAPEIVLGLIRTNARNRIQCNVILDDTETITTIRDKPAPDAIVGNVRWCGFLAFQGGVLKALCEAALTGRLEVGVHLGDLLEGARRMGLSFGTLWFPEAEININSVDDLLLVSMLEGARSWAGHDHPNAGVLTDAVLRLMRAVGIDDWHPEHYMGTGTERG